MSLREKIKRRFTGKKSSDASDGFPPRRKDIEYYKPNEIPKSKYRGKVDKIHQAQLEAYSLEGAFNKVRRRASQALSGTFSPGGTNARSAAASAAASAANSRRPSYARERSHLFTSATNDDDEQRSNSTDSNKTTSATPNKNNSQDSSPSLVTDDTDSPTTTGDISRSITAAESRADIPGLTLTKTITAGGDDADLQQQYDQHFSAEELEKAMTRATLRPRRGTVVAPVIIQPTELRA